MKSQYFGIKIYYDFSQFLNCSFEIYSEANLRLRKGCVISLKKSMAINFFFDYAERKKNKLLWNFLNEITKPFLSLEFASK